jgi:hypothetical protein
MQQPPPMQNNCLSLAASSHAQESTSMGFGESSAANKLDEVLVEDDAVHDFHNTNLDCDSMSFVSSDASTVASRSARRRRGRRAAKAKASRAQSTLPILESPTQDEIAVTSEMMKELCQQLERGGAARQQALSTIRGSVLSMAFEPFGCRIVQLAFEVADADDKETLVAELRGHVCEAVSSPHANFVLQKVIEVLPISCVSFVAEEMLTFAAEAARHRFACRILCRLVEHHLCNDRSSTMTNKLIDELMLEVESLIRHNFARHVIELILEHGSAEQKHLIAVAISNGLLHNARCRYASYVIEQAMVQCTLIDQDMIASHVVRDMTTFLMLATHECGSHVVKAVAKSRSTLAKDAREMLLQQDAIIKTSKHGQRLLEETK